VEEGVLAEQVGVDFFGIGEHHMDYFPMPAGDVVLTSIAARIQRIHLGSAVTVLRSDDPVRVFQRYSTLNALSSGRAEIILGREEATSHFHGVAGPGTQRIESKYQDAGSHGWFC
jgi:alkanesulfonate monooxygenase SsuD/methylene tetrahydromethanopterin reductase-like flavin-dependent oxidoreductase (luciferase family)